MHIQVKCSKEDESSFWTILEIPNVFFYNATVLKVTVFNVTEITEKIGVLYSF